LKRQYFGCQKRDLAYFRWKPNRSEIRGYEDCRIIIILFFSRKLKVQGLNRCIKLLCYLIKQLNYCNQYFTSPIATFMRILLEDSDFLQHSFYLLNRGHFTTGFSVLFHTQMHCLSQYETKYCK
jgi:hypothetical protein